MRRSTVSSMKEVEIADWMKAWKREQIAKRKRPIIVKR